MIEGLETTSTNLNALRDQYRAIANNLANVNTIGYKREVSAFRALLANAHQQLAGRGADGTSPHHISHTINRDFLQGSFVQTGRTLDVALDGPGFLAIETPDGVRYTRNGSLRANERGQLVDGAGRLLAGRNGPITIPQDVSAQDLAIARDGTVSAGEETFGKLKVVEFPDRNNLVPVGQGCYVYEGKDKPQPAENTDLCQGYQERSNVQAVEELIKLLQVSHLYSANIKSVNSHDERLKELLRVAGG